MLTLKTKFENNEHVSKGIAIVQFSNQAGASSALKNLPFESSLGDPKKVNIDFYKSLESRLKDRFENSYLQSQVLNFMNVNESAPGSQESFITQQLVQGFFRPSMGSHVTASSSNENEMMFRPPVRPDDFICPSYFIKKPKFVPPPMNLNMPAFIPNHNYNNIVQGQRNSRPINRGRKDDKRQRAHSPRREYRKLEPNRRSPRAR